MDITQKHLIDGVIELLENQGNTGSAEVVKNALAEIERLEKPELREFDDLRALRLRVEALERDSHPPLGQETIYERLEALERWRDQIIAANS
jgi:hypothetical protein